MQNDSSILFKLAKMFYLWQIKILFCLKEPGENVNLRLLFTNKLTSTPKQKHIISYKKKSFVNGRKFRGDPSPSTVKLKFRTLDLIYIVVCRPTR